MTPRSVGRGLAPWALAWMLGAGLCGPVLAGADAHPGRTDSTTSDQVLRVGPGRALAGPGAAARIARDGATVLIDAGDYLGDVAVWTQDRLTLRGDRGRARLHAAGRAAEGKAVWVIRGSDVLIEGNRLPAGVAALEGPGQVQ